MKTKAIIGCALMLAAGVAAAATGIVPVEVDAGAPLRRVDPRIFGINTAKWDESLFPGPAGEMLLSADRDAIAKIKASGVTVLKYPGGNEADRYIWNATTNYASEMDTDEYIALCREVGAEPFITVNFNEPPELAAEWVRYCNKVKGYNVKLWEVGDEQWGTWAKGHAPPEVYAQKYIGFVNAMRAVDPDIKVATNVPLGDHPENWTERVLKAAGDHVDMLTFTFFPQKTHEENDAQLLASTAKYREMFTRLRRDVERVVGKKKAEAILYVNVGYNSVNHSPGPQTLQVVNAIWTADMLGAMAETGTDIACFWALHNYYPPRDGDYGYLSSEGNNTPRPAYHVFPMFVEHFAGEILPVRGGDPEVSLYATRTATNMTLIAINKNPQRGRRLDAAVRNFTPGDEARVWVLDETRRYEPIGTVPVRNDRLMVELPPYSVVAVALSDRAAPVAPVNLAASAMAAASSVSVIGPHFGPASAIDGKPYTRWQSAAWTKSDGKEEQWLLLSWRSPQTFSQVRVHWGESPGQTYRVEVSDDGRAWRVIRRVEQGQGGVETVSFDPVTARHMRLYGERGSKGISAYTIREIEVTDPTP